MRRNALRRRERRRGSSGSGIPSSLTQALACARAADARIGEDTVILDIRKLSSIADYLVITTATSPPHAKAIAESVETAALSSGGSIHHREGDHHSSWLLLDLIDVIVHIFAAETRRNYDLESLWTLAPRVAWRGVARKRRVTIK